MRKRILLIAAPLVVVAIAASVAVASPSDAEHSRGPRLDRLHAERPIAATDSNAKTAKANQSYANAQQLTDFVNALRLNDRSEERRVGKEC